MARSNAAYFSFGGVDTRNYQIIVDSSDTLAKPTRDVERLVVPGRSGSLTVDNGRFNDVSVTYHCHVKRGFDSNFNGFLAALHALGGERKLVDGRLETYYAGTYNGVTSPGCYRKAVLDESVQPANIFAGCFGDFDITFTCKPQIWLNAGDVAIEVVQGTSKRIYNPTKFPSIPLLQLYGKGTGTSESTLAKFTVSGDGTTETATIGVNVNSPYSYLYVDCDMEDAYNGSANCNQYINAISDGKFPRCGASASGFLASVTSPNSGARMLIYPRWWTI